MNNTDHLKENIATTRRNLRFEQWMMAYNIFFWAVVLYGLHGNPSSNGVLLIAGIFSIKYSRGFGVIRSAKHWTNKMASMQEHGIPSDTILHQPFDKSDYERLRTRGNNLYITILFECMLGSGVYIAQQITSIWTMITVVFVVCVIAHEVAVRLYVNLLSNLTRRRILHLSRS